MPPDSLIEKNGMIEIISCSAYVIALLKESILKADIHSSVIAHQELHFIASHAKHREARQFVSKLGGN